MTQAPPLHQSRDTLRGQNAAPIIIVYDDYYLCLCGPGSSVGIATDYGLDGPGSNPGGDEIFHPTRPAVGPTQPPIPGLSRG